MHMFTILIFIFLYRPVLYCL